MNTLATPQKRKSAKAEDDPRIFNEVRDFLKVLNSGTGKPIELLSPADARNVLIDAQKSLAVDYSVLKNPKEQLCRMERKSGYML